MAQFKQTFQSCGAEPIEAAPGKPFDPNVHEAVMQDNEADLPEHAIAKVLQGGFMYRERVLRAAKVSVSTGQGYKGN